jgi:signal transduction histidine kinase/CHASE1-domain containing sensor protein/CheY-like chemotaxis protein
MVLAVSLGLTLVAWRTLEASEAERVQDLFQDRVRDVVGHLAIRMRDDEQVLRGAAGLFHASEDVTRDEWRRYVSTLRLGEAFPGIQGVGFARWIPSPEREAFVRAVQAEGFPEFALRPEGARDAYTAIVYLEPFDWRNQRAFGYDMYSEPVRRAAMQAARDAGEARLSGRIVLLQETEQDRQHGFLMYLPVFRRGAPTDDVAQRRAALLGWVYSPIRARDFVHGSLGRLPQDVSIALFASERPRPDALLFESHPDDARVPAGRPAAVAPLEVLGQRWSVAVRTLPAFSEAFHEELPRGVLAAGLGASLALGGIAFVLSAASRRALRLAAALRSGEAARRREDRMMVARLDLMAYALEHTLPELLVRTLDHVEELTGSRVGFYHFVLPDERTLTLQAWSTRTSSVFCRAAGAGRHYPVDVAGVWVDCFRERRPVIHDDYAALPHRRELPPGHAEIVRELVVPVFRSGRIVAVLGTGNKPEPYTDVDVAIVSRFADLAWDIAERKQVLERLHAREQELAQAQRLESVGRLAGGVAHDFNNMLSVIIGNADELLAREEPHGDRRPGLEEILDAARRSAVVTRQLLAFARRQAVAPRVLDLNDAVGGMLKMLRRLIGEDVELSWAPGAGLPPVRIDPSQVDQLLANLCVNARDAIAGVGRIAIQTAAETLDPAACERLGGLLPGVHARITVRDTGHGIAPEVLPHIFEPFFTTKPTGEGTGLGLATVYGIVKQNGGAIEVETAPGKGAAFHVRFPAAAVPAEAPARTVAGASPRGQGTVLVVEDEPGVLRLCAAVLGRLGYEVLAAGSPDEALDLAARRTGPIDLLLTDVVMPGMSGRALADALVEARPGLRCLFMSGYTPETTGRNGVEAERVPLLAKPFDAAELAARVREALGLEAAPPAA